MCACPVKVLCPINLEVTHWHNPQSVKVKPLNMGRYFLSDLVSI